MSTAIHATTGRMPIIAGAKLNGNGQPTIPSEPHLRAGNARKNANANTPGIRQIPITAQQANTTLFTTVQPPSYGPAGTVNTKVGSTH
jgi:hypothetical protein